MVAGIRTVTVAMGSGDKVPADMRLVEAVGLWVDTSALDGEQALSYSKKMISTLTRERKKIEIVLELCEWDPDVEYDRLGVDERKFRILDVEIPMLVVPVRPGRNMTTIIEVAARNHLLKLQGHHSAREFQERFVAGWGGEVFTAGNNWWWVPIVAPCVGAVAGGWVYDLCVGNRFPEADVVAVKILIIRPSENPTATPTPPSTRRTSTSWPATRSSMSQRPAPATRSCARSRRGSR